MPTPGYHGDYDVILYVTSDGKVYLVFDPDALKPAWRECDESRVVPEIATLETDDFEALERCRMAYGIPA